MADVEEKTTLTLGEKLQRIRVDLQNKQIKKTGENKFVNYNYFELADFLPILNNLMLEYKVTSVLNYKSDHATLTLHDLENPLDYSTREASITFECPMSTATLKGAHDVQNLGAVMTYIRRYLYITAFEIVESDVLDKTQGEESKPKEQKKTTTTTTKPSTAATAAAAPEAQTETSSQNKRKCTGCGAEISDAVVNFSMKKFKRALCMDCQKKEA